MGNETPSETEERYKVECDDCDYESSPTSRDIANKFRKYHKRVTGHNTDVVKVEPG